MKCQRELSIIGAYGGYSKTPAKHAPVVGNSVLNLLINILGSGSYLYRVKLLRARQTALNDTAAQGIAEQEKTFLHAECAEQDTSVRVVFHCLCHTFPIGDGKD